MFKLKNGADCILEVLTKDGESAVLASTDQSFVTWRKDNEGNCFTGNYFPHNLDGLVQAVTSLAQRAG